MTRLERITYSTLALLLAASLGAWAGWDRREQQAESDWASAWVLDSCVEAGFTGMALDLLPPEGADETRRLLRLRLSQQLDGALRRLPADGSVTGAIPVAVPNALLGLDRAERHCRGNGLIAEADKAAWKFVDRRSNISGSAGVDPADGIDVEIRIGDQSGLEHLSVDWSPARGLAQLCRHGGDQVGCP